jgi:hypothetical protein
MGLLEYRGLVRMPRTMSWATLSRPLRQAQGRLCGTEFWTGSSHADSKAPQARVDYAVRAPGQDDEEP